MKDLKFRVKNEAHSKAIQERLLELGARRLNTLLRYPLFTGKPYIHVDDNIISYGNSKAVFNISTATEATLEDLYDEDFIKDEPQFKVGDWITCDEGNKLMLRINTAPLNVNDNGLFIATGFSYDGVWELRGQFGSAGKPWRLATEEEVKEALIGEAKRRGFKEGAVVDCAEHGRRTKMCLSSWYYHYDNDLLSYGGADIYKKGEWAEIVEEEKPITIAGYEAEIHEDYVKFGCRNVKWETIVGLLDLSQAVTISMGEHVVRSSDLMELLNRREAK